jgi:uncharacterized tellurite resistance protein B-like protein/transcription elongation factor Elf1
MLLLGTMDWASTRLKGRFRCPTCDQPQDFRLRLSRPFLTLYFIPIIPIGGKHEYVECRNCRDAFETAVLSVSMIASADQRAEFSDDPSSLAKLEIDAAVGPGGAADVEFPEDLLAAIALCCIDDGKVSESEIETAQRVYKSITGRQLARASLAQACSEAQVSGLSTGTFFATAGMRRSVDESISLIQAIFLVASADGAITPRRLAGITRSYSELGLSEDAFREAIAEAPKWLGKQRIPS